MELQLGLGLPIQTPMKGFDLNRSGFEPEDQMVSNGYPFKHKRSFCEAFENGGGPNETLSLFLWNGQPNEEDDGKGSKQTDSTTTYKNDEEESHVMAGWPPIPSWRKKLLHDEHQGGWNNENDRMAERRSGRSNSMYVKVKMEGVAIGRKIDLRLYHSYQSLTNTLISMFDQKSDKDGACYTLLYQDNVGNWLLAGDVPWQKFMESVQRMEILRNAG